MLVGRCSGLLSVDNENQQRLQRASECGDVQTRTLATPLPLSLYLSLTHRHTATDADSSRAALIVGETAPAKSVRREMLRLRTLRLTASRCYDGKMAGPWGPGWINGVGPDETGPDVRVRRLQPELNRWLRSVGQQTIRRFMLPLDTTCNILSGIRIGISL